MADSQPFPFAPKAYYPALDGLRALAILMVFHFHYTAIYLGVGSPFSHWGWIGVDFFFVLSGFLITGILYDSRGRKHAYRDFAGRRMLRIFPVYYAIWLMFFLTQPLLHWAWPTLGWMWPLYVGNFGRFVHPANLNLNTSVFFPRLPSGRLGTPMDVGYFWTLCVEEQFYMIWPVVVLFANRRFITRGIVALLVLTPLIRAAFALWSPRNWIVAEFLYRMTFFRMDALLWGALLAFLVRRHGYALHRYGRLITLGSCATLVAYVSLRKLLDPADAGSHVSPWNGSLGFVVFDVFAFGLILELIRHGSQVGRVFSWQPARRLGQISYGFYAFHLLPQASYLHLVQRAFHRPEPTPLDLKTMYACEALAFVCTLILAIASFHLLESPFLRLKKYFPGQTHTAPGT